MKVSDYMPNLYKNNIEMLNIINSEETEFETHIKFDIDNGFANNFIKTADIEGIRQYEILLDIPENNTLTVEERRQNVIMKLLASIPYTYRKLCEILDSMYGKNSYLINQDINNYTMLITTDKKNEYISTFVYELLKKIIPANIEWEINLFQTIESHTFLGAVIHTGEYETFKMKEVV